MNASGIITDRSDWKRISDALQIGWESTFGDINGDGIIGQPITDTDGNGLVDGVSNYQIYNNDSAIDVTDAKGWKQYDHKFYHAIKAVNSGSGYKVLLEGDDLRVGQHYAWDLNESGAITKGSGWKNTSDAIKLGWESTFGDINGDGIIGQPIV